MSDFRLSMAFEPALSRIPRQKTTFLTLTVLLLLPADLKVIAHDASSLLLVDHLVQLRVLKWYKAFTWHVHLSISVPSTHVASRPTSPLRLCRCGDYERHFFEPSADARELALRLAALLITESKPI